MYQNIVWINEKYLNKLLGLKKVKSYIFILKWWLMIHCVFTPSVWLEIIGSICPPIGNRGTDWTFYSRLGDGRKSGHSKGSNWNISIHIPEVSPNVIILRIKLTYMISFRNWQFIQCIRQNINVSTLQHILWNKAHHSTTPKFYMFS